MRHNHPIVECRTQYRSRTLVRDKMIMEYQYKPVNHIEQTTSQMYQCMKTSVIRRYEHDLPNHFIHKRARAKYAQHFQASKSNPLIIITFKGAVHIGWSTIIETNPQISTWIIQYE